MNVEKIKISIAYFIMYAITLGIALHTPIHSDDYAYALKGIGLDSHINHYFTWSGRVISDYISGFILFIDNHYIRAAINSLAPVLLTFCLTKIGYTTTNKKSSSGFIVVSIIIFLTYWISNTNIGQTTFWLVGSANYLWTNVILCFFLLSIFKSYFKQDNSLSIVSLLLALAAGCSNENTGFVAVAAPALFFVIRYFLKKELNYSFALYSFSALIGYAILVLSPGNAARAKYFAYWYDKPMVDRLVEHFYSRAPEMISMLWLPLLMISVSLLAGCLNAVEKDALKSRIICSAAFLSASLLSVAMMAAAPGYPPRSGNGTLVLMLISMSFALNQAYHGTSIKMFFIGLAATLFAYFAPSYYFMYKSYKSAFMQNDVRMKVIAEMKSQGKKEFMIPDFYFPKLLSAGEKFDMYHSVNTYGEYFGVSRIRKSNSTFDYSMIPESNEIIVGKIMIPEKGTILESIYISKSNDLIVLKTNNDISSGNFKQGPKVYLRITYKGETRPVYTDFWPKSTKLTEYSWTAKSINKGDITNIEVGTYNLSGTLHKINISLN